MLKSPRSRSNTPHAQTTSTIVNNKPSLISLNNKSCTNISNNNNNSNNKANLNNNSNGINSSKSSANIANANSAANLPNFNYNNSNTPTTPNRKSSLTQLTPLLLPNSNSNVKNFNSDSIVSSTDSYIFSLNSPSSTINNAIKVFVRCRPFTLIESASSNTVLSADKLKHRRSFTMGTTPISNIELYKDENKIVVGNNEYYVDTLYDQQSTQKEIFSGCTSMINSFMLGYNSTIFACIYCIFILRINVDGQTSAGKTYTVLGSLDIDEKSGIIPLSFEYIFSKSNNPLLVSYCEIYNESVRDLFDFSPQAAPVFSTFFTDSSSIEGGLEVRQASNGSFYAPKLTIHRVNNLNDALRLLVKGTNNRSVGSTDWNEHSSRSHAILTIHSSASKIPDLEYPIMLQDLPSTLFLI